MESHASRLIRSLRWTVAACTFASTAAAAPTFQITVIDSLPLGERCRPTDINDLGHVALDCSQSAFFWTPEDGVVEIPAPSADHYVSSAALNNHDVVVARVHSFDGTSNEGVLWDPDNGLRFFSPQDPLLPVAEINAINDAGTVGGIGWVPATPSNFPHAFLWTESTGFVDPWPEFDGYTQVRDINELGVVLLWTIDDRGGRPWFLDVDGTLQPLSMSFCPMRDGQGSALNDLKQAVGFCYVAPNTSHAAVWLTPRRGQDIDRRPAGTGNSYASSINNDSQVVGFWNGGGHNGYPRWETAFYWDPQTPMIGLHRLLDPADPLAAGAYFAPTAIINETGQIATAGSIAGEWHVVVLTPVNGE